MQVSHQPLAGKVAWVTGSSRGLGRVIATHLGTLGASLVVHGTSPTSTRAFGEGDSLASVAEAIAEESGAEVQAVHGDLTDPGRRRADRRRDQRPIRADRHSGQQRRAATSASAARCRRAAARAERRRLHPAGGRSGRHRPQPAVVHPGLQGGGPGHDGAAARLGREFRQHRRSVRPRRAARSTPRRRRPCTSTPAAWRRSSAVQHPGQLHRAGRDGDAAIPGNPPGGPGAPEGDRDAGAVRRPDRDGAGGRVPGRRLQGRSSAARSSGWTAGRNSGRA